MTQLYVAHLTKSWRRDIWKLTNCDSHLSILLNSSLITWHITEAYLPLSRVASLQLLITNCVPSSRDILLMDDNFILSISTAVLTRFDMIAISWHLRLAGDAVVCSSSDWVVVAFNLCAGQEFVWYQFYLSVKLISFWTSLEKVSKYSYVWEIWM